MGKTGSCSGGQDSKTLILLSAGGWGCAPSLVVVWPQVTQLESTGSKAGLMATSERTHSNMRLQGLLPPMPLLLRQATANLHLKHSQVDLAHCSVGSLLLSPGFWRTRGFVCALQEWSLFPPILRKSCNKIPLAFEFRFTGDSPSLCQFPSLM